MKKLPVLSIFLLLTVIATAQTTQQQKNDSLARLIRQYFNERSSDKLYQLGGKTFHDAISADQFKSISEKNLFPLGDIKELLPEKYNDGVSYYKAVFAAQPLTMVISHDSTDKLVAFLFQPYVDQKAKKTVMAASSNPLVTPLDKAVDSIARMYIQQQHTVGLSIGVLKDGKTWFYGYGETAAGDNSLPNATTLFEIGSISKTFTGTLLAIAIGEGKVRLDDPVNRYLPDSIPSLQYNGKVVTLRELSNHSSAIPRMPSNFFATAGNNKDPYQQYPVDSLFSYLKNLKLAREPGAQYEYSNTAVGLLGVILQRIYHLSYEALLRKYITGPLGMSATRVALRKEDSVSFARGYDESGQYNGPWNLPVAFVGAGGIRSTANDMLRYAAANLGKASGPLQKAIALTHDTTFANAQVTLGLNWHYIRPGNEKILFHNGGTGGYRTYLAINTQQQFAVVLLANTAISVDEEGNALMRRLESL